MMSQEIHDIFQRGHFHHDKNGFVLNFAPGDKPRAFEIARSLGGPAKKEDMGCPACCLAVVNTLRKEVGYPPLVKSVPAKLKDRRLAVCEGCDRLTDSVLGKRCAECGCFVNIKAAFKIFDCPLNKWPNE